MSGRQRKSIKAWEFGAIVVFGAGLIAILVSMYNRPGPIQPFQWLILVLFAALCAGLVSYFVLGALTVDSTFQIPGVPGDVKASAAGGFGAFLLMLLIGFSVKPAPKLSIAGTAYAGTKADGQYAPAGTTVNLDNAGHLPGTVGQQGRFSFEGLDALPKLLTFNVANEAPLTLPYSAEGQYFLNLPLVDGAVWKPVEDIQFTAVSAGSAGAYTVEFTMKSAHLRFKNTPNAVEFEIKPSRSAVTLAGEAVVTPRPLAEPAVDEREVSLAIPATEGDAKCTVEVTCKKNSGRPEESDFSVQSRWVRT